MILKEFYLPYRNLKGIQHHVNNAKNESWLYKSMQVNNIQRLILILPDTANNPVIVVHQGKDCHDKSQISSYRRWLWSSHSPCLVLPCTLENDDVCPWGMRDWDLDHSMEWSRVWQWSALNKARECSRKALVHALNEAKWGKQGALNEAQDEESRWMQLMWSSFEHI